MVAARVHNIYMGKYYELLVTVITNPELCILHLSRGKFTVDLP